MRHRKRRYALYGAVFLVGFFLAEADACTGIRLVARDGTAVYGRTMEWGAFDLESRVAVVPRGYAFPGIAYSTVQAVSPFPTTSILDNFNVPLGAAEGSDAGGTNRKGMRSATIWTTAWDLSEKVLYFHTQHSRRVRKVDAGRIDFSRRDIVRVPLDDGKEQDVKDITPATK
jgi:penicillin V acylase-like amidase (Ntn superfamily)